MKKRIATVCILLLAFFGLADSIYITRSEITGSPLLCNIQTLTGCNIVAQSPYANLFGIPLSEYGLIFYAILFATAALELIIFHHLARRVMQGLSIAGFVMSAYFVILQIFVIQALCIYCLASALFVLGIFALSFLLEPLRKSSDKRRNTMFQPTSSTRGPLPMPPTA